MILRRVEGKSMWPALRPGQVILGRRPAHLRVGQVVVIHHKGIDKIKRISGLRYDQLQVRGDNAGASTDSRDFGWLSIDNVQAKVVWPRA